MDSSERLRGLGHWEEAPDWTNLQGAVAPPRELGKGKRARLSRSNEEDDDSLAVSQAPQVGVNVGVWRPLVPLCCPSAGPFEWRWVNFEQSTIDDGTDHLGSSTAVRHGCSRGPRPPHATISHVERRGVAAIVAHSSSNCRSVHMRGRD